MPRVRLNRPNRNWKDLVALATLERREELRREQEAAEAAEVAARAEPCAEEEASVVEVSGARLASSSDDEPEPEPAPPPARRTSRFAVTPVKLPARRLSAGEAAQKEAEEEQVGVRRGACGWRGGSGGRGVYNTSVMWPGGPN